MRLLGRVGRTLVVMLGVWVAAQFVLRLFRRFYPFPVPPAMSPLLQSPLWYVEHTREEIVRRMGVCPGMAVLEVGAGPGLVTAEVAQALQPDGQLSTVDAQPAMVAQLGNRLRRRGVLNAMARVADPQDLPFPAQAFDLVYMVAALGAIENRGRALREVRRVLKPNGRLAITEAITAPDYMLMAEVVGWAQTVGFELVERKGNAFLYTLVFRSMFGS